MKSGFTQHKQCFMVESRSHIYDTSRVIYIGPVITTCILPTIHTWYIKTTAHNLVCNLFPVLDFDLAWSFFSHTLILRGRLCSHSNLTGSSLNLGTTVALINKFIINLTIYLNSVFKHQFVSVLDYHPERQISRCCAWLSLTPVVWEAIWRRVND